MSHACTGIMSSQIPCFMEQGVPTMRQCQQLNPHTPLGCPKRKKEENFAPTPLNDRDNPSPKRMRIIPPSSYHPATSLPIPSILPTPHSLKAGCRMSQNILPPIDLKDDGVNTHIPAQKGHIVVEPRTYSNDPREIQKAEVVLAALHKQNLTISQFLTAILDPKNEDKLTPNLQSALVSEHVQVDGL